MANQSSSNTGSPSGGQRQEDQRNQQNQQDRNADTASHRTTQQSGTGSSGGTQQSGTGAGSGLAAIRRARHAIGRGLERRSIRPGLVVRQPGGHGQQSGQSDRGGQQSSGSGSQSGQGSGKRAPVESSGRVGRGVDVGSRAGIVAANRHPGSLAQQSGQSGGGKQSSGTGSIRRSSGQSEAARPADQSSGSSGGSKSGEGNRNR